MADVVIALTTVPSLALGETIARALVEADLAACVNVLPAMTSVYRWQGIVEHNTEHQLMIKTTSDRVAAVEARIRELHPYELPEFLVVTASGGSHEYLEWVRMVGHG
jgi:periplasmic divalent cation tolerance protein